MHPDYLLQTQILEDMRMRWFNLTDDAYHDLVCGLTRSKHFELAIDKMEEMQDQKVPIKPWLYDLVIYALLTVNEVNEAARILRYREKYEQETQISPNVWFYLLETASRNLQVLFPNSRTSPLLTPHSTKRSFTFGVVEWRLRY